MSDGTRRPFTDAQGLPPHTPELRASRNAETKHLPRASVQQRVSGNKTRQRFDGFCFHSVQVAMVWTDVTRASKCHTAISAHFMNHVGSTWKPPEVARRRTWQTRARLA